MNRQSHPSSQANDNFNGGSQQLTLNVTLKDLNIEARRILRKELLQDNIKTSRDEEDVYVSGPYFPCVGCKLKNRLRKNSTASLTENFTNDGQISKAEKSPFVEIMINEDKSIQTKLFGKIKVFESYETLNKPNVPILSVSDLTDEHIPKLEETEDCLQQGTTNNELESAKLELRRKQIPDSRQPGSKLDLKTAKEKQSVMFTTELQEGTINNQVENTTLSEEKRNQLPRSPISRRSSSQLDRRGTMPLFERRRDSRMSYLSNDSKTSPNYPRNNHISPSTDQFALENILNPLLRESLKKILNPQSYMENAISDDTEDNINIARETGTIFKDDIFLPKIKRRLVKYNSLDYGDQRSSVTNDLSDKYRSIRHGRFMDNKRSPELRSTKSAGIVVTRSHPVRMLSAGSQYAVKGLIGQWLKRHSETTNERERASVQKQETYREIQLLKVGLSMRMLAGIV